MYPAQALADGDYFASDLPDAVTVDGTSFNRSGTGYGNTTNGVILEGNVWAKYRNGRRSEKPCLIQGGVVDQFADTYTLNHNAFPIPTGVTVTRVSLCVWRGSATFEGSDFNYELDLRDQIAWRFWLESYDFDGFEFYLEWAKRETETESSPVGEYEEGGGAIFGSVS
jgi:hypothetical protein